MQKDDELSNAGSPMQQPDVPAQAEGGISSKTIDPSFPLTAGIEAAAEDDQDAVFSQSLSEGEPDGNASEPAAEKTDETAEALAGKEEKIRLLEAELETLKKEYSAGMEKSRSELAGMKIMSGIKDAAVRCGFIDPAEAALHLRDSFGVSGGEVSYKGRRLKEADLGKAIAAAVKGLSEAKPHLIRFERKPGSGVVKIGTQTEPRSFGSDFSDPRTKRKYEEELRKRGIQPLNPV